MYIENGAGSYSAVNSKVHKTAYTSSSTEDRIAQNGPSVKKDTESYSIPAEEDFDKYELSSEEKEFIEKFSNREYNNRGWASLLFSQEDASLLNEYFAQRFKLNHKDSGITLGDGTKVIEVNNKIVFAGGTFNDPIIYCVLVVNAENNTDFEYLKELYLEQNDYRQLKKETVYSWYRDIQEISGEEIFRVFARRDYIQTQRTTEGRQPPILPNSWRGFGYSKEQHRRGSYKAKNKRFEIRFDDDVDYSIPSETSDIYDRYDRGEISREELTAALQKEWMKAGEQYGTYEPGEKDSTGIRTPKQVTDGKNVRRFVRTILESGALTDEATELLGKGVLMGDFSYDPISDKEAMSYAESLNTGEAETRWKNLMLMILKQIYNLNI